jgi:outer membrane protein TolC
VPRFLTPARVAPLLALATAAHALSPDSAQGPHATPSLRLTFSLGLAQVPAERPGSPTEPPAARAATSWAETLLQADGHAAALRAALAGAEAAGHTRDQARAQAWMPRVDLAASTSRDRQQVNDNPTIRTPSTSLTMTATLPLWRAADRAGVSTQEALREAAQWQARATRAQVAQDTSTAYLGWVEALEQARQLRAQQSVLRSQLQINERRLQGGAGTVLDTLETRTRLAQTDALLNEQSRVAEGQALTLQRLTGQPPRPPAGFQTLNGVLPDVVPPQDEALALAEARNPNWQQARLQAAATQATVSARQAEGWQPTVDAFASASRLKQVPKLEGFSQSETTRSQSMGVQLNWALFSGGAQSSRIKEAGAQLAQAQAQLDDTREQVLTRLADAYQALARARLQMNRQREVETTAQATFDAVRKAFVAGVRTNQDLLDAQQQILAARQALVTATVAGLNAQVSILALLDRLDAERVAPLAPLISHLPPEDTP